MATILTSAGLRLKQFLLELLCTKKRSRVAIVIGIVFAISICLLFTISWPKAALEGDAANIACVAVGLAHPDNFSKDHALSNPDTYAFYTPVYVHYVKMVGLLTNRFDIPFRIQFIPGLFLKMVGGYLLFRLLTFSPLVSLFCTMFFIIHVPGFNNNYIQHVLPRTIWFYFFPLFLYLALKNINRPTKWIFICILWASLMYVHPVSSLHWSVAIPAGFFAADFYLSGRERKWTSSFKKIIPSFIASFLVILPYGFWYLYNRNIKLENPQRTELFNKLIQTRVPFEARARVTQVFVKGINFIKGDEFLTIGLISIVCLIAAFIIAKKIKLQPFYKIINMHPGNSDTRIIIARIVFILTSALVVLGMSLILPFLTEGVAKLTRSIPVECDIHRPAKFIVIFVLLIVSVFSGLLVHSLRSNKREQVLFAIFLSVCFGLGCANWIISTRFMERGFFPGLKISNMKVNAERILQGKPDPNDHYLNMALYIRKNLPKDACFGRAPMWVRYLAYRSIAVDRKTGNYGIAGKLGYFEEWQRRMSLLKQNSIEACHELGAEYEISEPELTKEQVKRGLQYEISSRRGDAKREGESVIHMEGDIKLWYFPIAKEGVSTE